MSGLAVLSARIITLKGPYAGYLSQYHVKQLAVCHTVIYCSGAEYFYILEYCGSMLHSLYTTGLEYSFYSCYPCCTDLQDGFFLSRLGGVHKWSLAAGYLCRSASVLLKNRAPPVRRVLLFLWQRLSANRLLPGSVYFFACKLFVEEWNVCILF